MINKKNNFFALLLSIWIQVGFAQTNFNYQNKIFFSLTEANKVNPDSVFNLYLGNMGLEVFPSEIYKFKNLQFISLVNHNIGDIYQFDESLLSPQEKDEAIKIFRKYGWETRTDIGNAFPTYNKSKIKHIPEEIKKLEKLNILYLDKEYISKKEMKELKKWLPGCYIVRM